MSAPRELNPVAYKDLLVFARTPGGGLGLRALWISVALALPLLGLAWVMTSVPGPWRFAARPAFLVVAALMALFNFSVAVPAATAFALERDRETLEGLVVSPLSRWRLVLGKLTGALVIGTFTKSAMLPPLALAFALGGEDLSFVPAFLLLLLASDMSFASFALLIGARRMEAPARVGWLRTQTSQAQLALQSSAALSVVASLIPVYAGIFLVPIAYQQGLRLEVLLDALAPLGVLHPLAALLFWGPIDVFGVQVPLWLLGVGFHVLITLPMLADAAEAQRTEGAAPGRAPRLLLLPALVYLFVLTGAGVRGLPRGLASGLVLLLPAVFILLTALRTGFVVDAPRVPVSRAQVLRGFLPHLALESCPGRAPGYVFLVALLATPLLVASTGGAPGAWLSALALTLAGVSVAAVGARLVAWGQEQDDRAFLEAVRRGTATADEKRDAEETDESTREAEESDRRQRLRGRVVARGLLLTGVLPLLAMGGLALGQGSLPALAGLRPLFLFVAVVGLGLNPLAATLPVLLDPNLMGGDGVVRAFATLGLDPWHVFAVCVVSYSALLVLSLLTLRAPLDLEAVLGEHLAGAAEAVAEPEAQTLPEDAAPEDAPLPSEPPADPQETP